VTSLPAYPDFKKLELHDRATIESFTLRFEPYSDLNFTSMWCWDIDGEVEWSVLRGNLVVRLPSYGIDGPPRYTLLGDLDVRTTVGRLLAGGTVGNELNLVPEVVVDSLRDSRDLIIREDPDNADYVVDIAKFVDRSGGGYANIRKKINRFARLSPKVIELDLRLPEECEFVTTVSRQWLANHPADDPVIASELKYESAAIARSIGTGIGLSLGGLGVLLDGEPCAFKLYERVGPEWCVAHFAKTAWPMYGASEFAMDAVLLRCLAGGARFYNEEQDLGVLGLRTAKRSHRPLRFLRKYSVSLDE